MTDKELLQECWTIISDLLEELGLSSDEELAQYPHVTTLLNKLHKRVT